MESIQSMLDSGNKHIILPPGEYKGSFYINNPCIIEGNGTTLWNNCETIIKVCSNGVFLKNLRVELINKGSEAYSVSTDHDDTQCENVEIIGNTKGFKNEDLIPDMEKQLSFGKFKADVENTFKFDLYAPAQAEISINMKDVMLSPLSLTSGINTITAVVAPMSANSYLYGDIILKSAFVRRFYINGSASEDGEQCTARYISKIDKDKCPVAIDDDIVEVITTPLVQKNIAVRTSPSVNQLKQMASFTGTHFLKRGERVYIEEYADDTMKMTMGFRGEYSKIDIDPYIFMLDATGNTSCDDDFVYFGNQSSSCGSIKLNDDKTIEIYLGTVPQHIERISFAYSIYLPGPNDNFSKVLEPFMSISQYDKTLFKYTANDLFAETTIIFIEIYRHKSQWRINTIGQGYKEGLKKLCSSFGLIVS